MTYDAILSIAAFVLSVIIGIRSLRKTDSETHYLDAQTYTEYQEALRDSHTNYQAVLAELAKVRIEMKKLEEEKNKEIEKLTVDIRDIQQRSVKLEAHNRALTEQIIAAQLVPITIEEALKRGGKNA